MALDPPDLLARAGDHSTPGDELARLAAPLLAPARARARAPHDVAALAALASNPNAPPELLFSLAPTYAGQVAANPALVLLLLENPSLLATAPFHALRCLLARPELPLEWLEQGARLPNYQLRLVAAESRRLAPSTLRLLANDPHSSVRLTVAANPSTPPEALAALACVPHANPDPHPSHAKSLLRALASNPTTPLSALESLSDEVDLFPTAARDPALSPSLIEALVMHPSPAVRAGVAQRQDLPPRFVRRLAADPDVTVRAALARHATDQALLSRLSFSSGGLVRRALVDNPHTPPHALERLAHAPVARSRRAARERLAKQRAAARS